MRNSAGKLETISPAGWMGIILLVSTLLPVFGQGGLHGETRQLTVVQEKAPLFKERSISSPIIRYLEKGSKLNLLAVQDSFYLVSYGGYEGWVIPYSVEGAPPGAEGLPPAGEESPGAGADRSQELDSGRYLIVTNSYANVREGPGLNYKLIGKVYLGDKLEKFIKRGRWYRVRLPDTRVGFIREDLVSDPSLVDRTSNSGASFGVSSGVPGSELHRLAGRISELERQLKELRQELEEQKNETRKLLLELQRLKGTGAGTDLLRKSLEIQGMQIPGLQPRATQGKIIGNTVTKIYHLPSSIFYDKIPEEYRVYFDTEEQAVKAGYTKSIK